MTTLRYRRLVILSKTERRARCIDFHPRATVITGPNHLGKSFLIKTLFWTLGADSRYSDAWKAARVSSLLYFTLGDEDYAILRDGKEFTIFDGDDQAIAQFGSVSSGLGPFLAGKLHFGLRLFSKGSEKSVVPPPAFYFLPFYLDQDSSWTRTWDSFKNLEQMRNWKNDVPDYHSGIKPNSYYELGSEQSQLIKVRDSTQSELDMVRRIRDELVGQLESVPFTIDLAAFEEEVTAVLLECEKIQRTADGVRDNLVKLHNDRMLVEAQTEMVTSSLRELGKDYAFIKSADEHVNCPLCQATYPSDFSEVFEIALDQDRCEELLSRLREERSNISDAISKESAKHSNHQVEVAKIRAILEKKKEQVSLGDLIESESRKEVSTRLKGKISSLNDKLLEAQSNLDAVNRKLKALVSKEKKREILRHFKQEMRENFLKLGIPLMNEDKLNKISPSITLGGSYQPRALLAYWFSILALIKRRADENDAPVFAPIIIDSPIQQDQDTEHHLRIMQFIKEKLPEGAQLIVGVVDDKDVDYGGKAIRLNNEKRSVLLAEEYETLFSELEPYIQRSYQFRDGTLL
ncbi:hypothetical protein DES53_107284 [Roseimicrobium gellanilyticum]|uniref:AAA domain-containing protein n=1 Tax=Roseimicrobium gellanilyticum TaxID=748857 RepID=A0A366HFW4_9BACT|nr:hypothetical protein [Roseimicrobium gellanilyticum]RBP41452.1 hypothetical protein DES53_107284 [Roseimicrobium gellanilyticum]